MKHANDLERNVLKTGMFQTKELPIMYAMWKVNTLTRGINQNLKECNSITGIFLKIWRPIHFKPRQSLND